MSLEKHLAQIEVFKEDIINRSNNQIKNKDYINYLDGIVKEASLVEDSYYRARKAIKKGDKKLGNVYVGNFAVAAKNLTDNLNRFMQSMYSKNYIEEIELKDLKTNIQGSPVSVNNIGLYKEFAKVHDWSQSSGLNKVRNIKAHGGGHNLLHSDLCSKSNYLIKAGDFQEDSFSWLDRYAEKYLGLASTCLHSISLNEKKRLDSKSKISAFDIFKSRFGNFANRHKGLATGLVSTIAVASLFTGFIGANLWDHYQKNITVERDANSFTKLERSNQKQSAFVSKANANFFCELAFGMDLNSYSQLEDTTRKKLVLDKTEEFKDYFYGESFYSHVNRDMDFLQDMIGLDNEFAQSLKKYMTSMNDLSLVYGSR